MVRKIFLGILGTFILTMGLAWGMAQKVDIYCDDDYAPYSYVKDGKAVGIYVDILTRAFSKMPEYEVTIVPVPWQRGLDLMERGKGFALFPPYFRPQVRPFMDYPAALLEEGYSMVGSKTLKDDAVWPDDFVGMKVGVNRGYNVPRMKEARAMGVRIVVADTIQANIMKVAAGEVDAYINDRNTLLWNLREMRKPADHAAALDQLQLIMDISHERGYLGFTNRDQGRFPFKQAFIIQFVRVIQTMKESGEIQKILDTYTQ